MMGRQLQKAYNDREKCVLTTPIINGTDGRKMSKSYGNYVALTENPVDMYGKLMRISDDMIVEYFTVLTDVSDEEIETIAAGLKAGDNPMTYKKQLAYTITEFYHDAKEAEAAQKHFEKTVQNNDLPADMPSVKISGNEKKLPLLELLKQAFPDESNNNLRRLIDQGAVELQPSKDRPTDNQAEVDLTSVEVVKLGKRRFVKLEK